MSAGAPRRRTLLRPAAQNLSLSLVEHPSFKFRTFGAYDSGFSPPTSIDEEPGESDDMVFLIPHNPPIVILTSQAPPLFFARGPCLNPKSASGPPSAWKSATAHTPFSAVTIESVYSQDSWDEPKDVSRPDTGKIAGLDADEYAAKQSANQFRVDRRRFGVAFSPNAKFILPLASAAATKSTFVLNLPNLVTEKPISQCPSPSPEERIPHAVPSAISDVPDELVASPLERNDEVIVAVAPQPVTAKALRPEPPPVTAKAPRSAKSTKFTFDRSLSMSLRSPVQGLSRFLSRVSLPAKRTSRSDKRQTVKQVPPPKRRTVHPIPPVPSLHIDEESIIVFDLRNGEVVEAASDVHEQTSPLQPAPLSLHSTHEAMGSHNNGLLPPPLPAISISPLDVQFDGSMVQVL